MLAIIGTVLLAVVIILSVAIILGAPLGEFTLICYSYLLLDVCVAVLGRCII